MEEVISISISQVLLVILEFKHLKPKKLIGCYERSVVPPRRVEVRWHRVSAALPVMAQEKNGCCAWQLQVFLFVDSMKPQTIHTRNQEIKPGDLHALKCFHPKVIQLMSNSQHLQFLQEHSN